MRIITRLTLLLTVLSLFFCCQISKPKKSIEDLRVAFNYESTSAEKYAKFAQTAMREGFDTISQLFKAVSQSESFQATNHGKAIEKLGGNIGIAEIGSFEVKTTGENLQAALKSEIFEIQSIYPGFIRDAEFEKAPDAAKSFTWAWDAEKIHLKYYRKALAAIANGNESAIPYRWLVCPTCGNTYNTENVKGICDFCLTKQEKFFGYQEKPEGE